MQGRDKGGMGGTDATEHGATHESVTEEVIVSYSRRHTGILTRGVGYLHS